ncbi:MAG: glutamate racemase [Oligoflexia bacterium]|nr:glutamate racemase [Oligoflexia bacterium]
MHSEESKLTKIANPSAPIGVFDSGLGGLTVLRALRQRLPQERFVYLGDTARTPYGSKSPETIRRYARECAQFLQRFEVKLLVVACNTVSSWALDELTQESAVPVIGTLDTAVSAVKNLERVERVGIVGTQATISSHSYEQHLIAAGIQAKFFPQACPLFVPLVEQGMYEGEIVEKVIELYLAPLKKEAIDTLILGCTHYPMLAGAIGKFMGEQVRIVESSEAIAAVANQYIGVSAKTTFDGPSERYFVTDDVGRFNALSSLFLEAQPAQRVTLEALAGDANP